MKAIILLLTLMLPLSKQEAKVIHRVIKNDVYDLVEIKNGMMFTIGYEDKYRMTHLIFIDSEGDCIGYVVGKKITKYDKFIVVEQGNKIFNIKYRYYSEESSIGDLEQYLTKLSPDNKKRTFVPW